MYTSVLQKKLTDNETIEFDILENGYLLKEGCKAIGFPSMTLIVLTAVFQEYSYRKLERNMNERTELNKVFNVYLGYGSDVHRIIPRKNGKITLISYNKFKDMINNN